MSIGENIRHLRLDNGLSQMELARQAHVSGPMINMIERGTKVPSLLLSAELAKVLQCSVNDFLDPPSNEETTSANNSSSTYHT